MTTHISHNSPTLSIIIVSYNTRDVTRDCLKSIYAAEWRENFEIIVVDNNSQDGSVEMIEAEFPKVKLIVNPENRLFSIANNQGANIANGKYLLLLNSDTLIYKDNIQRLIDFFETQPEDVICIGPKILNKNGSLQSCGHPGTNKWIQLVTIYGLDKILPLYRLSPQLYRKPDRTHCTGWVSGCCMMIKTSLFKEVGGLNENLVFYGEEPEFGYRSSLLGYKTLYYSESEIIHLGGVSTRSKEYDFETDICQYDRLISQTLGYKRAIFISRMIRMSLMIKWLFYKNKKFVASKITHEGRVIDYFKQKIKLANNN